MNRIKAYQKNHKWTEAEDAILRSFQVTRVDLGCQPYEGQMLYRYVNVYGTPTLGYLACYEEYFAPNSSGGPEPEFHEILFATAIWKTLGEALNNAVPSAAQETKAWLKDINYLDKPR